MIGFLGSPVYSTDHPGTTRGVSALNKKGMKVTLATRSEYTAIHNSNTRQFYIQTINTHY